jgi:hypothetical protein
MRSGNSEQSGQAAVSDAICSPLSQLNPARVEPVYAPGETAAGRPAELGPCSRARLDKLIVVSCSRNSTQWCVPVFTNACTDLCPEPDEATPLTPSSFNINFNIILLPVLSSPSCLLPSGFPTKALHALLCNACYVHCWTLNFLYRAIRVCEKVQRSTVLQLAALRVRCVSSLPSKRVCLSLQTLQR